MILIATPCSWGIFPPRTRYSSREEPRLFGSCAPLMCHNAHAACLIAIVALIGIMGCRRYSLRFRVNCPSTHRQLR
jgi:hypothetical protein